MNQGMRQKPNVRQIAKIKTVLFFLIYILLALLHSDFTRRTGPPPLVSTRNVRRVPGMQTRPGEPEEPLACRPGQENHWHADQTRGTTGMQTRPGEPEEPLACRPGQGVWRNHWHADQTRGTTGMQTRPGGPEEGTVCDCKLLLT